MMPTTEFERMMLMMLLTDKNVVPLRIVEINTIARVTSKMLYSLARRNSFCLVEVACVVCIALSPYFSSARLPPVDRIMMFASVSSWRDNSPCSLP